jgi:hypothetical protein
LFSSFQDPVLLNLPPSSPSLAFSTCDGGLGNILSTVATLHVFGRQHGVTVALLRAQLDMLLKYFQPVDEITVLEDVLPDWQGYNQTWYNWSVPSAVGDLKNGHVVNVGRYPNELPAFHRFLPETRKRFFSFKKEFRESAEREVRAARRQFAASVGNGE